MKNILEAYLDAQKQLKLTDVPELTTYCQLMPDQTLVMTSTDISVTDDNLIAVGMMALFGSTQQIRTTLTISQKGTDYQFEMSGKFFPEWKIGGAFGELPGSWKPSPEGNGLLVFGASVFDDIIIDNAAFIVTNYDDPKNGLLKGINLKGDLVLNGDFINKAKIFLPIPNRMSMSGSINMHEYDQPVIDLSCSIDGDLSLGHLKVDDLFLKLTSPAPTGWEMTATGIQMGGTVNIGEAGSDSHVAFKLKATVADPSNSWLFTFEDVDQSVSLGNGVGLISQLAGLDINFDLPSPLDLLKNIYLKEFNVGINPSTRTLQGINFKVGLDVTWDLIPGQKFIAIDDPYIGVSIVNPVSKKYRVVSYSIGGAFILGKDRPTVIDVTAHPQENFEVNGKLEDGDEIPLGDALAQFVQYDHLPDLTITSLAFRANKEGYMFLQGGFDANWEIPFVPNLTFSISNALVNLEKDESNYSAFFSGNLALDDFSFHVIAKYAQTGWDFTGSTNPGTDIKIGKLISFIGEKFGVQVPDSVIDVELSNLLVGFNTGNKFFRFHGDLSSPLKIQIGPAEKEIELKTDLSSWVDAQTQKRQFEGKLIGKLKIGAEFIVTLGIGSNSQYIRGTWIAEKGETIGLEDLLEFFDIHFDIPDEVDLNLTKATFEYDKTLNQFTLSAESKTYGDAFFIARNQVTGWGFVFGMDMPEDFQLSDIPVVGEALEPADFLSFKQAAFMLSSAIMDNYKIPALPPLAMDTTFDGQSHVVNQQKPVTPIGNDVKLQLQKGITVVAIADMTNSDPSKESVEMGNVRSIVKQDQLVFQISAGTGGLQLFAGLGDTIEIPVGDNKNLTLSNPAFKINISSALLFQISGGIGFDLMGTHILATALMTIGTNQAQVGVSITSDNSSLPSPPGIKGLHLKQFGMIMGVYFTPPGASLGLQGKFTIGEGQEKEDEFAFVLQVIGPVINPLFLSFYLEEMSLGKVYTLFTDEAGSGLIKQMDVVNATNLSFYWAQNVVVLPDGTVAQPGFGFSAMLKIFNFGAYGAFQISAGNGMRGHAEMSPVNLKGILSITGDGKGIFYKMIEKNGNWVRAQNTEINREADLPVKEVAMVQPGGPVIQFSTMSSPFLHANWSITLFDAVNQTVDVTIDTSGATFSLDFNLAKIQKYSLNCTLKDWSNFSATASYSFGIDTKVGPFKVLGVDCGTLHVAVKLRTSMGMVMSPQVFSLSLTGDFKFMGLGLSMPKLMVTVAPKSLAEVPAMVIENIKDNAKEIFSELFDSMEQWADLVAKGLIDGFESVEHVLKNAFNATAKEAAKVMQGLGEAAEDVAKALKSVGYAAEEVAGGLKSAFKLGSQAVAGLMKDADYAADEVAKGLQSAFKIGSNQAAKVLKGAGYAVSEVAGGLKSTYNLGSQALAKSMKAAGYVASDVASGLHSAFNLTSTSAAKVLKGAGYAANDVASGLKSAYNLSNAAAATALKGAGYAANQVASGLKSAYGLGADATATLLKSAGFGANQIAKGMKSAFSLGSNGVAKTLKNLGYGINDVGNAIGNTFGFNAKNISSALKGAGYAANQVGGYLKATGRFADNVVNGALKGAGYAAKEVSKVMGDIFGGSWIPHVDLPYVDIPKPHIDHVDLPYVDIPKPHIDGW
ncbi:hypothetical protein BFP97_00755 [Roseivirga sp. 4D4]|uniref:hypothetical protein n=1 Tax=Roseivirga sp. 4D4 TaxID=1889784 RepID=UPI000853D32A|nr:hypothetical protein [Roseivirga sp. 4D4]OEK00132.1 hypothetical protein BFP97_00755 [Roseivirga sp. 4D4]